MPQRVDKWNRPISLVVVICSLISACSSVSDRGNTTCTPLVLSPHAITQAAEAGRVLRVRTKQYLYTLVDVKLNEAQVVVGVDYFSIDKEARIPLNEIKSICTLPGNTYDTPSSEASLTLEDLSHAPLLIMLPAVPLAPFFQSPGSKGMTKEEVRREIGKPIRRYVCGPDDLEIWEYEKGVLFPKWTSVESHNLIKFRWWDDLFWPFAGVYSKESLNIFEPCKPYTEAK